MWNNMNRFCYLYFQGPKTNEDSNYSCFTNTLTC